MFEQIMNLSEDIIKNSYSTKGLNDELFNQLGSSISTLIRSQAKQADIRTALIIKRVLTALKTKKTYQQKLQLLTNPASYLFDMKVPSSEFNNRAFNFLIAQYYHAMADFVVTAKTVKNNFLNIIPKPGANHVLDLYNLAIITNNLPLFKLLYLELAPPSNTASVTLLFEVLNNLSYPILNFIFETISSEQLNALAQAGKANAIIHAYGENQKILMQKILTNDVTLVNKKRYFHVLLDFVFNEHAAELLSMMLQAGIDINCSNSLGYSLIHQAAGHNSPQWLEFIITMGGDVNLAHTRSLITPLHRAMQSNQAANVKILIKAGANIEAECSEGLTPLLFAIGHKSLAVIPVAIGLGADINNSGNTDYPPLHLATQSGKPEILQFLLNDKKIKIYQLDKYGNSAFHKAAAFGDVAMMKILLEHGAKINLPAHDFCTALHYAIKNKKPDAVLFLIKNGADVNAINDDNFNSFQLTSAEGDKSLLAIIKENSDININLTTIAGDNPIHIAVRNKNNSVIPYLINTGTDLHALNKNQFSPIQLAISYGNPEAYAQLKRFGADVKILSSDGCNLLHIAAANNRVEFVDELISQGININAITNNSKYTALDFAIEYGYQAMFLKLRALQAKFNPNNPVTASIIKKADPAMQAFILQYQTALQAKIVNNAPIKPDRSPYENHFAHVETKTTYTRSKNKKVNPSKKFAVIQVANVTKTSKNSKGEGTNHVAVTTTKQVANSSMQKTEQANSKQVLTSIKIMSRNELKSKQQEKERKEKQASKQEISQEHLAVSLVAPTNFATIKDYEADMHRIAKIREHIKLNFASNQVYCLHRNDELDHINGRPVIKVFCFAEKVLLLIGSSSIPKVDSNQKYLALDLSDKGGKLTYFSQFTDKASKNNIRGKWLQAKNLPEPVINHIVAIIPNKLLETIANSINFKGASFNNKHPETIALIQEEENDVLLSNAKSTELFYSNEGAKTPTLSNECSQLFNSHEENHFL